MVGAVLVGGASRRMGVDKATLPVDGVLLGERAVRALRGAGVQRVLLVGAGPGHVVLDGEPVPDTRRGAGPVGGVLTALEIAVADGAEVVVVLACDLPWVTPDDVLALLRAAFPSEGPGPEVTVVLGAVDGRAAPPNGVWPAASLPLLAERFELGARSFRDALGGPAVTLVDLPGLRDADTPDALPPETFP